MARPREFDETTALDAAMDCFWRDGYEATSVRDLAARMGITGASLYNAFGDKRSLFREVLQRYAERSTRERIARLESTLPPKQAVVAFLGEIVERSVDGDRRGCLLVNTALEIAPHDPVLGAEVAGHLRRDRSLLPPHCSRSAGRWLRAARSRAHRSRPIAARRHIGGARAGPVEAAARAARGGGAAGSRLARLA